MKILSNSKYVYLFARVQREVVTKIDLCLQILRKSSKNAEQDLETLTTAIGAANKALQSIRAENQPEEEWNQDEGKETDLKRRLDRYIDEQEERLQEVKKKVQRMMH